MAGYITYTPAPGWQPRARLVESRLLATVLLPANVVAGTATGSFGFTGPASGVPVKLGVSVTDLGFAASAVGTIPVIVTGTATGVFGFDGSATGTIVIPPMPYFVSGPIQSPQQLWR